MLARSAGSQLYLRTDLDAERGRLVRIDLDCIAASGSPRASPRWSGSPKHTLMAVEAAGEASWRSTSPMPSHWSAGSDLDGTDLGEVAFPAAPSWQWTASPGTSECFLGLSSVTSPTLSYRIEPGTGEVTPLPELVPTAEGTFTPPEVRGADAGRRPVRTAPGCRTS